MISSEEVWSAVGVHPGGGQWGGGQGFKPCFHGTRFNALRDLGPFDYKEMLQYAKTFCTILLLS